MLRNYITVVVGLISINAYSAKPWRGTPPALAKDFPSFAEMTNALVAEGMHHGVLASSRHILAFFSELNAKEFAYEKIIEEIDFGYPIPVKNLFTSGDIEPAAANFPYASHYNFYKGLVSEESRMEKWADHYFKRVDQEKFPKFLFFKAVKAFEKGDLGKAEESLNKILQSPLTVGNQAFVKKAVRTLARVLFERKEYERSLAFYTSFLLKVNPVTVGDWLEAGWNFYYLKRHEDALGALYNLESKFAGVPIQLEKYVLRSMIYRDHCATENMGALLGSFESEFGTALKSVKTGELLSKISELAAVYVPQSARFHDLNEAVEELRYERKRIGKLAVGVRQLAEYVYDSEIKFQEKELGFYSEEARQRAAESLVSLSEKLRFLKFDVAREKYNPDAIFTEKNLERPLIVVNPSTPSFQINWIQHGDYWRDERLRYRAMIENKCDG